MFRSSYFSQVWLKLENMQPTHSFRLRSVVEICLDAIFNKNARHLVSLGLTNESLAISYVARRLSTPATIFIPTVNDPLFKIIKKKIQLEKATIVEYGASNKDTIIALNNFVKQLPNAVYISENDIYNDLLGNSAIIYEAKLQLLSEPSAVIVSCFREHTHKSNQCTNNNPKDLKLTKASENLKTPITLSESQDNSSEKPISLIKNNLSPKSLELKNNYTHFCALRNLSLLAGILSGISSSGWNKKTPVIGVETFDSSSLNQTLSNNSKSTSNNTEIHTKLLNSNSTRNKDNSSQKSDIFEVIRSNVVIPISVSDQLASQSAAQFTQDHQFLVGKGTALPLSLLYNNIIKEIIPTLNKNSTVLVILDGSSVVSFDSLNKPNHCLSLNAPVMVCSGDNLLIRMANKSSFESGKSIRRSDLQPTRYQSDALPGLNDKGAASNNNKSEHFQNVKNSNIISNSKNTKSRKRSNTIEDAPFLPNKLFLNNYNLKLESDPGYFNPTSLPNNQNLPLNNVISSSNKVIKIAPKEDISDTIANINEISEDQVVDSQLEFKNSINPDSFQASNPSKMSNYNRSQSMSNAFMRPPPGPAAKSSLSSFLNNPSAKSDRKIISRSSSSVSVNGLKKLKMSKSTLKHHKLPPKDNLLAQNINKSKLGNGKLANKVVNHIITQSSPLLSASSYKNSENDDARANDYSSLLKSSIANINENGNYNNPNFNINNFLINSLGNSNGLYENEDINLSPDDISEIIKNDIRNQLLAGKSNINSYLKAYAENLLALSNSSSNLNTDLSISGNGQLLSSYKDSPDGPSDFNRNNEQSSANRGVYRNLNINNGNKLTSEMSSNGNESARNYIRDSKKGSNEGSNCGYIMSEPGFDTRMASVDEQLMSFLGMDLTSRQQQLQKCDQNDLKKIQEIKMNLLKNSAAYSVGGMQSGSGTSTNQSTPSASGNYYRGNNNDDGQNLGSSGSMYQLANPQGNNLVQIQHHMQQQQQQRQQYQMLAQSQLQQSYNESIKSSKLAGDAHANNPAKNSQNMDETQSKQQSTEALLLLLTK
ncbi:L-serine dehydratase/L-threonine deaminase [Smittium culicis]|uniref:L-serine ammonia-lyase n=1 Tax=Smittium culicis TaxID=133412 RepID=A0A1R1YDP4_9FUNG|nr:L-serine dehydratase/L-threonine deaminase [Smittium culicis]